MSRLAKDPELAFEWLDTMASQPNEFIKQGYHQPRVTLSNGKQALDPALARKYIPYYDQVFKGELAKTAVWLSSTKGNQVTDRGLGRDLPRDLPEDMRWRIPSATLQSDIKGIYQ